MIKNLMKLSTLRNPLAASVIAALTCITLSASGGQTAAGQDLEKRIAELEAGQKAILKELQEIKALLQSRPPTPAPAPSGAAPQPNQAMQHLTGPPNFDLDIAGAPTKGRPDAKLVVVEFSDFQCPFCGRYTRETMPQVEREYVETGKIRYVFRHFPLERLHPLALRASEAAECAFQQGKFWPMHLQLFANQQALAEPDLTRSAQALGVNMSSYQVCMAAQLKSPTRVRQDQTEGARAGITGTPTFFIGTMTAAGKVHALKRLVGAQPFAAFKTTLDALLSTVNDK
jgi:protein-disulfide isomerase